MFAVPLSEKSSPVTVMRLRSVLPAATLILAGCLGQPGEKGAQSARTTISSASATMPPASCPPTPVCVPEKAGQGGGHANGGDWFGRHPGAGGGRGAKTAHRGFRSHAVGGPRSYAGLGGSGHHGGGMESGFHHRRHGEGGGRYGAPPLAGGRDSAQPRADDRDMAYDDPHYSGPHYGTPRMGGGYRGRGYDDNRRYGDEHSSDPRLERPTDGSAYIDRRAPDDRAAPRQGTGRGPFAPGYPYARNGRPPAPGAAHPPADGHANPHHGDMASAPDESASGSMVRHAYRHGYREGYQDGAGAGSDERGYSYGYGDGYRAAPPPPATPSRKDDRFGSDQAGGQGGGWAHRDSRSSGSMAQGERRVWAPGCGCMVVTRAAGFDRNGYLTWPGKVPARP